MKILGQCHLTKQLVHSPSVNIRISQPSKVITVLGLANTDVNLKMINSIIFTFSIKLAFLKVFTSLYSTIYNHVSYAPLSQETQNADNDLRCLSMFSWHHLRKAFTLYSRI